MTEDHTPHEPDSSRSTVRPRPDVAWLVATGAITAALVAYLWWPAARLDFFFDEMWRIEQVRSSNPLRAYLDGPAPIPPGWVVTMSTIFDVVPDRRLLLRLAAAAGAVPAAMLLAIAISRVLERRLPVRSARPIAVVAAPLTVAVPAIAGHLTYFNNYVADVLVATAIVWVVVTIDDPASRSTRPWWALLTIAVLAPWFGQGALFLLPGAAVIVYRRRSMQPRLAAASAVAAGVSSVIVGVAFLRPVANGATLTDYWRDETPGAGFGRFVRRLGESFIDGAYPQSIAERPIALAALLAFTMVGAVVVHRAWSWWLVLFGTGFGLALLTSVATGWPATFVRGNSSFQVLLYALAPIGIGWTGVSAARALRTAGGPRLAAAATVVAVGLVAWAAWAPRSIRLNSTSTDVFARGLTEDVRSIALRATPGDLVVAYHLSGPYVRDGILNAPDVADGVMVVDEARTGSPAISDLADWTRETTRSIWCVVPFEAGSAATATACTVTGPWQLADTVTGRRANLLHLLRAPEQPGDDTPG